MHTALAILVVNRVGAVRYSWRFVSESRAHFENDDTRLLATKGPFDTYDRAFDALHRMDPHGDFCFLPHEAIRITASGEEHLKERNASRKA